LKKAKDIRAADKGSYTSLQNQSAYDDEEIVASLTLHRSCPPAAVLLPFPHCART
jgi:hypothetical protein